MEAKEFNKIAYDSLMDIHKHIFEQLKYAETKNHILLTINIAIIVMFIRYFFMVENKFDLFYWWYVTNFSFFVLPVYFILKAFFPKLNNAEKQQASNTENINIYFFEQIKSLSSLQYLKIVKTAIGIKRTTNKRQLCNLSNQIVVLSDITSSKHFYYKKAFNSFIIASGFFIVSYILTIGVL